MATLHINFLASKRGTSGVYEALTTSGSEATTTAASAATGMGEVELYSNEGQGHIVSFGEDPDAETDEGRIFVPSNEKVCRPIAKGSKVSAIFVDNPPSP